MRGEEMGRAEGAETGGMQFHAPKTKKAAPKDGLIVMFASRHTSSQALEPLSRMTSRHVR